MSDAPDDSQSRHSYSPEPRERGEPHPIQEQLVELRNIRNKHRLLRRVERALEAQKAPGDYRLVDAHPPTWFPEPDHYEIAGLFIWDTTGRAHHFRVYRDQSASFIKSPTDPDAPIAVGASASPAVDDTVYSTDGPPPAVTERFAVLDLRPTWKRACADGHHGFELADDGVSSEYHRCKHCELPRNTLSWLGHRVPREGSR